MRAALRRALAAASLFALTACAALTDGDAVKVLKDIEAGSRPSALKDETPPPRREELRWAWEGRTNHADLYTPGEAPQAGLVLTPGLTPLGKDDPRLVALAETFARARFLTLVPEIPGARRMAFSPDDQALIADGAIKLAEEMAARGLPDRLGLAAISYAAAPAMLAAMQPDVADDVDFVIALGGYHDTREVIAFVTTDHVRDAPGAAWRPRKAHPIARWFMAQSMAGGLSDADERWRLQSYVNARLRAPDAPAPPQPDLGEEGDAILALVRNRDPKRVERLVDALPQTVRDGIAALNLAPRDLSALTGKLILIHGEADSVTPPGESGRLAARVPGSALFLAPGFSHIELHSAGIRGKLVLAEAMSEVLRRRDGR